MDELERRGWLVRVKERGVRSDDILMVEEYKKKDDCLCCYLEVKGCM